MRRLSIVLVMLTALCFRAWAQHEKGLVAYWDFDQGKGDILHDRSGNKNDGKIHGAKWLKLDKGYALRFNGVDAYVDCGSGEILNITDKITIEAWIKAGPTSGPIVAKYGSGSDHSYLLSYSSGANNIYLRLSGTTGSDLTSTTDVAHDKWHHIDRWYYVVGTWDGSVARLYIDGIQEDSKSKSGTMNSNNVPVTIGRAARWGHRWFNGTIDEVRIYNRALSGDEVKRRYELMTRKREYLVSITRASRKGPVAHWDFDEGKGDVLHDRTGNNNHGKIYGATWASTKAGHALEFNVDGDYVDCGDNPRLKIMGDITIATWVKLTGPNNPDTNWHIVDCEEYRNSGFMLRVDGQTSKLCYRTNQANNDQHMIPSPALNHNVFYHIVVVKQGNTATFFIDGAPDAQAAIKGPVQGALPFKISSEKQSFKGLIDDVKIYDRAISRDEIVEQYRKGAGERGKDASWFDRFGLTPYLYFDEGQIVIEVDFRGILPLQKGDQVAVELGRPQGKPLDVRNATEIPKSGKSDFDFAIDKLQPGEYEIRAVLRNDGRVRTQDSVRFRYPLPPPDVPSPDEKMVPPLPDPLKPVAYNFELCDRGGFKVLVEAKAYLFESSFSYPHGGENTLLASSAKGAESEASWTVTTRQLRTREYEVTARGKYYAIDRRIVLAANKLSISDKIRNLTNDDIGIIIDNHLSAEGKDFAACYLGGMKQWGRRDARSNPTTFVGKKNLGIGLVGMDDVYIVHGELYRDEHRAGILDNMFALAPNASYTMRWSIYLVRSEDYFDFINAVREDLGLNGRTVEGNFAFIPRHNPPSKDLMNQLRPKYVSAPCLSHCADDPGISIEGIEFIDFPKERAFLKKQFAELRKLYPDVYFMFHIAPSLYATNRPERYADSRTIDSNGKPVVYTKDRRQLAKYFSKERLDAGWEWHIFYPTLDNSFGKAMLRSADVMADDIGAAGLFGDNLMRHHGGRFTFDRWDGHTVEIDPKTKTIKRKFATIYLLSQNLVIAYCKKVASKGGAVICDGGPITMSFAREAPVAAYTIETSSDRGCRHVHLTPFPTALGHPRFKPEPCLYRDIQAKLNWGVLYFYYYGDLGRSTILSQMYPITIEEIHSGCIKGRERLITALSGPYGWPGDTNLHFAYLSDGRGILVPHSFLTTVGRSEVRTEIALRENEMAVLKKIPVTIRSDRPINLIVERYDDKAIQLVLNGKGKTIEIVVRDGDFRIKPGVSYTVRTDATWNVTADKQDRLLFKIALDGQHKIRIEPAEGQ